MIQRILRPKGAPAIGRIEIRETDDGIVHALAAIGHHPGRLERAIAAIQRVTNAKRRLAIVDLFDAAGERV
jgi:hypothetical protein